MAMKFMATCPVAWADVWPTYRECHLRPGPDADRAFLHVEWRLGIPAEPSDFRFSGACLIRVILHDGVNPANPPVSDDLHGVPPFLVDWRRFPGFLARVPLHPDRPTAMLLEAAAVDGPVETPLDGTAPLPESSGRRSPGVRLVSFLGAKTVALATGFPYGGVLAAGGSGGPQYTSPAESAAFQPVMFLEVPRDTKLLACHEAAKRFFERLHPTAAGRVTSLVLYAERDVWVHGEGRCRCFQDVVRDVLFVGSQRRGCGC
eukprot:jgi/Mesvir1/13148/Mv06117-RA.1